MPLFEFHCPDCGARFEKLVRATTDQGSILCPSYRSARVEQQFSTFASVGGSRTPQPGGT